MLLQTGTLLLLFEVCYLRLLCYLCYPCYPCYPCYLCTTLTDLGFSKSPKHRGQKTTLTVGVNSVVASASAIGAVALIAVNVWLATKHFYPEGLVDDKGGK